MKSLIDFPEEVATPFSSAPKEKLSCQAYFETIGYEHDDSEIDKSTSSTSSTITDSSSDSGETDTIATTASNKRSSIKSGSDDENHSRQERSVSFGPIHVRQYERIVGDHPETKVGVPLAIGWAYYEDDRHPDGISIERYECDRIQRRKVRMSSISRKNLLLNVHGLSEQEVREAEQRSKKLQKQREKAEKGSTTQSTVKKLGKKIRKGGLSILKGLSQAGQMGVSSSTAGIALAADYAF